MLIYTGKGDHIAGIPAKDLNDTEVVKHGGERFLIGTGLYKRPTRQTITEPTVEKYHRRKSVFEEAEKESTE